MKQLKFAYLSLALSSFALGVALSSKPAKPTLSRPLCTHEVMVTTATNIEPEKQNGIMLAYDVCDKCRIIKSVGFRRSNPEEHKIKWIDGEKWLFNEASKDEKK